jgi:hypothetical protein
MRLFFTAKSAKSTKENALPSGEKSLFQLRSSWFVVEICYLQFRRFGWGFAALCLCARKAAWWNQTRSPRKLWPTAAEIK